MKNSERIHNELEEKAFELYEKYIRIKSFNYWNILYIDINYFIDHKELYESYFDVANIILRKEKLNNIKKYAH